MYLAGLILVLLPFGALGSRERAPLPPGPPADPLIGHLRIMPSDGHHIFFYELGKKYGTSQIRTEWASQLMRTGDVIYLNALGRSMVVLNSAEAAVNK